MFYTTKLGTTVHNFHSEKKGDFITSPKISNLFSEIIAIWIISCWKHLENQKILIFELGPGDGSLTKVLLKSFKKFPEFNSVKKIFLFEESNFLKRYKKRKIVNKDVKWIKNFNKIKKGPVIFFEMSFLMQYLSNNLKN